MSFLCSSRSINKAHKLLFGFTSLSSNAPFKLIYTDIWDPAHCVGLDGSHYYLLFIDHHTKCIWFYSMETKVMIVTIFPQFKKLVENLFQCKIKTIYSDNRGEHVSLKYFLSQHGISYFTTAPHIP